jgi:hypothetical protein
MSPYEMEIIIVNKFNLTRLTKLQDVAAAEDHGVGSIQSQSKIYTTLNWCEAPAGRVQVEHGSDLHPPNEHASMHWDSERAYVQ